MITSDFSDKTIAITGACGTVGTEVMRQVVETGARVIGLDNNESEVFFARQHYDAQERCSVFFSSILDKERLTDRFDGVDLVIHAAALKNVPVCEESPTETFSTNVIGTQNVIDAAVKVGAERVLLTSTDKAVNPTTVMGTTKLLAERLFTAANSQQAHDGPIFAATRFGNVLGSAGSVLPLFARQIAAGGPVTLTDPDMTRFVMTLQDAARLVLESVFLAAGGEVLITKMPVIRIEDLARVMIELLAPQAGYSPGDISIKTVGARPGEKLFEELMNTEEVRRSYDIGDFLLVKPPLSSSPGLQENMEPVDRPYISEDEDTLTPEELKDYLVTSRVFENMV